MNSSLRRRPVHERGVVLLFCLIVLVILMVGSVAVVRSMNASQFAAGNLAFRRDLVNQGEQAIDTVLAKFRTGGALASATTADLPAANYKASTLATNAQGVPTALLDDEAFAAVGQSANDLSGATSDVKIRYLIDRLCTASGTAVSSGCVQSTSAPTGGTAGATAPLKAPTATVYRLSIRVTGPRDTQVFLQSSFTKQD